MGHVPMGDVFAMRYRDNIADFAGVEQVMEGRKKVRVAQDVPDYQMPAGFFGGEG
jgi:hypothetical protein